MVWFYADGKILASLHFIIEIVQMHVTIAMMLDSKIRKPQSCEVPGVWINRLGPTVASYLLASYTQWVLFVSVNAKAIPAGSYIYACTNETHSLTYLSLLWLVVLLIFVPGLVVLLEDMFRLYMDGCNYPAGIVFG